jgi:crossover junction endodeoxyribonuclease RuvC
MNTPRTLTTHRKRVDSTSRTHARVIGIDPGYERCGFAVLEKGLQQRDILLFSECFRTSASLPFVERLCLIGAELERLVDVYEPTICALEKLYFTSNQKTGMHVAEVRGVLLFIAARACLTITEYGPGEVTAAVAGDGRGDKRQVMAMVRHLIQIDKEIKYDDEFDAIAVALTARASAQTKKPVVYH